MKVARVIHTGGRQAILLPKDFRVKTKEVYLRPTPEGFLVMTRDAWDLFFEGVQELSSDFMAGGRDQPRLEARVG